MEYINIKVPMYMVDDLGTKDLYERALDGLAGLVWEKLDNMHSCDNCGKLFEDDSELHFNEQHGIASCNECYGK